MMTVVAVMAILAGIAVPSFQSMMTRGRVGSATNDLLFALNLARTEAIRKNTAVRFCVDADNRSWLVETTDGTEIRVGTIADSLTLTPKNLDTTSVPGEDCVRFRADGLPYGAGSTLITKGSLKITGGDSTRVINVRTGALYAG